MTYFQLTQILTGLDAAGAATNAAVPAADPRATTPTTGSDGPVGNFTSGSVATGCSHPCRRLALLLLLLLLLLLDAAADL